MTIVSVCCLCTFLNEATAPHLSTFFMMQVEFRESPHTEKVFSDSRVLKFPLTYAIASIILFA